MSEAKDFRVAVVTPYHGESEAILRQCLESVRNQTYPVTHFMVADGRPSAMVADWPVEHIRLPRAHADNGNTPRAIGSVSAINLDYDAIAYLDADNWYQPDHIAGLVELHRRSGAVVCSSNRTIHRLDGSVMYWDLESNGVSHVDTSCLLITRPAYRLVALWALMPKLVSPQCDRVFWMGVLGSGMPRAHRRDATVAFRSRYATHYLYCGEPMPPGGVSIEDFMQVTRAWAALPPGYRAYWESYFQHGGW